jgi:GNAT superfamily N-acetyltransferase
MALWKMEKIRDPYVQIATTADLPAWLMLAAEVEPLFGPMVEDPAFLAALTNNVERGSAYCIRKQNGPPGTPLLGGLLFSAKPPIYRIGWLAVTAGARHQGLGSLLLRHALAQVTAPATVTVTTFGPELEAGLPARQLYLRFGFVPAEMTAPGADGGSRQIFQLHL